MNELKVESIKFLMNMFQRNVQNSDNVATFKFNVANLVFRRQVSPEVRDIIYDIYGIANTDVYKPNKQANKLFQLSYLMSDFEGNTLPMDKRLKYYETSINEDVKAGMILASVRDIFFRIYDIGSKASSSKGQAAPIPTPMPARVAGVKMVELSGYKNSPQVREDIGKFRKEYLDNIYYRYDNPGYDGCSGSSMYLYSKITETEKKPKGAVLVYHKVVSDDGCHTTWGYVDIPKDAYKSTLGLGATIPRTTSASKTVSAEDDPCTGGGVGSRFC